MILNNLISEKDFLYLYEKLLNFDFYETQEICSNKKFDIESLSPYLIVFELDRIALPLPDELINQNLLLISLEFYFSNCYEEAFEFFLYHIMNEVIKTNMVVDTGYFFHIYEEEGEKFYLSNEYQKYLTIYTYEKNQFLQFIKLSKYHDLPLHTH